MIIKIIRKLKNIIASQSKKYTSSQERINQYLKNGRVPWSSGYVDYKIQEIRKNIQDQTILKAFSEKNLPLNYGMGLDERITEYPWIFSQMPQENLRLLDAGSTFNFDFIVNHPLISNKELCILTYAPESPNYNEKKISYLYADLRDIPFKESYFDLIVSQSTIEHIDMDNSMYGYEIHHHRELSKKSYQYLIAVAEMIRVLKDRGTLLLTFPFGKFENHGFFQQFDDEMLERITTILSESGNYSSTFFRYTPNGWIFCSQEDCREIVSYNPHTGMGKGTDGAAHCRSICCIKFEKNI